MVNRFDFDEFASRIHHRRSRRVRGRFPFFSRRWRDCNLSPEIWNRFAELQIDSKFSFRSRSQFLSSLTQPGLTELRQLQFQRPSPQDHPFQASHRFPRLDTVLLHHIEQIPGFNNTRNMGNTATANAISVQLPFEFFHKLADARVVERTIVPRNEDPFFNGELFVRPFQDLQLGIIVGEPFFDIVFESNLAKRPPCDGEDEYHRHHHPHRHPVAPRVFTIEELSHASLPATPQRDAWNPSRRCNYVCPVESPARVN